jgi:hypothetical protein
MQQIMLVVLCGIVVAFCGVVYLAIRRCPVITTGQRIVNTLLITPHFLLIVCILVTL